MSNGNSLSRVFASTAIVLASLFAGCGGGGGGGGGDGAPTVPVPTCGGLGLPPCTIALRASGLAPERFQYGPARLEGAASAVATRVDFLIDGTVVASSSAGSNAPGAATKFYSATWDTTSVSDGAHAFVVRSFDKDSNHIDSTPVAILVANTLIIPIQLSVQDILPSPASTIGAAGQGELTVNLATGALSGQFTVSGINTIDSAHVHRGYAGRTGSSVLSLSRSALDQNRWDVPAGSLLATSDVGQLVAGALYIDAHSSSRAFPEGAIRAQILPRDVSVAFANMTGSQVVPAVNTSLVGMAAVTVEGSYITTNLNAFVGGELQAGTGAHANFGAIGMEGPDALMRFTQAGTTWTSERFRSWSLVENMRAGSVYVSIDTTAHPNGEVRGQVRVPFGPTLSEIQASIFTPRCTSCHDGSSTALPGSMDLREGQSHAALVNVSSTQQSTLKRVDTYRAADSYLIHKLEGVHTITGDRMPRFGPYLTRAELDAVRAWIHYGTVNE